MKSKYLIRAASVLLKSRKAQIVLLGLQLGYLVYELGQDKNEKPLKRVKI